MQTIIQLKSLPKHIEKERKKFFNGFREIKPLTSKELFLLGMEGIHRNNAKNDLNKYSEWYLVFLKNIQLETHNLLGHSVRVALNAEYAEIMVEGNPSAAFYCGLLHDIGKTTCTNQAWFTDENLPIDEKAFKEIKKHALKGFEMLSSQNYLFVAMIAGTHHLLRSENSYGINPMEAVVKFSTLPGISERMKDIKNMSKEERNKKLKELKIELIKSQTMSKKGARTREIKKIISRILTINKSENKSEELKKK